MGKQIFTKRVISNNNKNASNKVCKFNKREI